MHVEGKYHVDINCCVLDPAQLTSVAPPPTINKLQCVCNREFQFQDDLEVHQVHVCVCVCVHVCVYMFVCVCMYMYVCESHLWVLLNDRYFITYHIAYGMPTSKDV